MILLTVILNNSCLTTTIQNRKNYHFPATFQKYVIYSFNFFETVLAFKKRNSELWDYKTVLGRVLRNPCCGRDSFREAGANDFQFLPMRWLQVLGLGPVSIRKFCVG
jgi:hypothetical protein